MASQYLLQVYCILAWISVLHCETKDEYLKMARDELRDTLNKKNNVNVAHNVIFFIGDGMGMSTVTAARILKGQRLNMNGKQPPLSFEGFPNVGLSMTYSNDRITTDSSCSATAYLCGVKANFGTVGLDPSVAREDCEGSKRQEAHLSSILKWSSDAGKSTGFVTNSRVTHATPAGGYAHTADRFWEGMTETPEGCKDVASQLFDNQDMEVIMGGGRRYILLANQTDPGTDTIDRRQRTDGRDLIKEWQTKRGAKGKYVFNKGQLEDVDPAKTDYLLGLFSSSHMSYEVDRDNSSSGQPSLKEMVSKAIKILKKNKKGYFLFVEASRIDHAHHQNYAQRALLETLVLDEAVAAAVAETDEKDTLILVTADHSHVFNIAGYAKRTEDILGFADPIYDDLKPSDNMPYTTLVYGNGPGKERENITGQDTKNIDYRMPVAVNILVDTHSGEDVAMYARGPMSHLFDGVHEQHYIPHALGYASCVGSNKNHCNNQVDPTGAGSKFSYNIIILTFGLLLIII